MAGDGLLAAAAAFEAGGTDPSVSAQLQTAFSKAAAGKENGGQLRDVALRCFKACQTRLAAQPSAKVTAQLAAVGRAALGAVAAAGPATAAAQLQGWRYNFARRLVSCKVYTDAHAEAWLLFQQLDKQTAATASAEAANLAIGTVLTLVLCCVEGKLLGSAEAVAGMVQAADSLPTWLSQLQAEEAAKHSDAAYKYLYKAALSLLEQKAWQQMAAVCGGLLGAAGSTAAAQQRAVQTVGKLAGHMPEEHAAAALTEAAVRASAAGALLSSTAAMDLLGLLCSATQRAQNTVTAQQLQQAVLSCTTSSKHVLQPAALLLPALAAQQAGSGKTAVAAWLEPVHAAVAQVTGSIQQLEQRLAAASQPPQLAERQRQLAVLEAAFQPANTLRRVLAGLLNGGDEGSSGCADVCRLLGGTAGILAAASALDLLAGLVGLGGRAGADSLASQGHAAAVGLVTAARLRAACATQQPAADGEHSSGSVAIGWLLGWDLQQYCAGSAALPPPSCPVEPQELSWLASALFNVGVDMHAAQLYAAAAVPMQASLAAAAAGLCALTESGSPSQDTAPRLANFCRKCLALSDVQQRAGDAAGALASLGHSTALLLQLGFEEATAWRQLVQAFVQLQAELPVTEEQQPQPSAAAQPGRRGKAGGSNKGAAVAAAAAFSSSSSGGGTAAADMLLANIMQQHAQQLPEGSLAAVLDQELHCWAGVQQGGGSSASSAASRIVRRLLHEVFPPAQQPVEHAGVLLALQQLGLPAEDGQGGERLSERAVQLLAKAPGDAATAMLARVRCMLAVDSARQLARQALLEQKLERQRSHANASTSAVGSAEQDAEAVAQLAGSGQADASAWQRVMRQAQQAVEALQAACSGCGSGAAGAAFEELSWLLALHGEDALAQQLRQLLPGGKDEGSTDPLSACLFPHATANGAELQQQAEATAAEGSRTNSTVVRRSALHSAAAEALAAAGDMVPALYHASEGHRLLAGLFLGEDGSAAPTSLHSSSPIGWWRLAGAYLGSLLQLGQLFEAAGLADEALHALREAQRLAVAASSRPVAALLAARLAHIYCNQGQLAAAEQAAASAEQQLSDLGIADAPALQYCSAAVQLARAQLDSSTAPDSGSISKAAWLACKAAVDSCQELADAAGNAAQQQQQHNWCIAQHASALLTLAAAALQRDDRQSALEHAAAAVAATEGGAACSALRHQRAAALLFLGQHGWPQPPGEQHLAVWGLGQSGAVNGAAEVPAAKGRARKAPAKQPAARGRAKAAAAAAAGEDDSGTAEDGTSPLHQQHLQHLWQALALSKGQLGLHRMAAAALAEACGRHGYLHLAACLLHSSLGSAMRLQYQLVLHSRRQQLVQRQRRVAMAAAVGSCDAAPHLQQLEVVLGPGLDWQLIQQLAGDGEAAAAAPANRGRKGAATSKAAASATIPAEALAALEKQARQRLHEWRAALPAGTAACSISMLPSCTGASLLISRLAPSGKASPPPLLVAVPVQQLSASLSQHPIRALRMDEDSGPNEAVSSVQSVLDEMQAVLDDSGRSMRELSTDTKEQQREWWRARVSLDDRLAALVKHLDSSWLGPWRCLLLGDPLGDQPSSAGQAAAQRLEELLEAAGQPASAQQAALLHHLAAVLARHASSGSGGMSAAELRQAAHQICHAAGLVCSQEQQHELAALLSATAATEHAQPPPAPANSSIAAGDDDDALPVAAAATAVKGRRGGKSVKFADEPAAAAETEDAEPLVAAASRPARGRRPAAAKGRKAASAAAMESNPDTAGGGETSPIATLGSVDSSAADEAPLTVARGGLCQVFDSLSLDEAAPSTAAAGTTAMVTGGTTAARASKHRSRLRMMQGSTPGPATARKALAAVAATAPRAARDLPLTVAKTAPPPAARHSSSEAAARAATGPAAGPVLLVLDGTLQALPWESAPGLLRQRLYRMPNLACAAASAQRSAPTSGSGTNAAAAAAAAAVDLASTFYALNPSGDLTTTQTTFQDWFRSMRGWQGKAGSPPSATEMAAALQSHQFFLYCGHGGGEQYISAAKLRSLERCSAALLMGCSSGRLRAQQHYEPVGAVLAYLLAGCPAAVANLWDVTDRDIDRFSQAVLTSWISGGASSSSEDGRSEGTDMSAAVASSRAVCKLPHLVGAAPVCYGIPSRVTFSSSA